MSKIIENKFSLFVCVLKLFLFNSSVFRKLIWITHIYVCTYMYIICQNNFNIYKLYVHCYTIVNLNFTVSHNYEMKCYCTLSRLFLRQEMFLAGRKRESFDPLRTSRWWWNKSSCIKRANIMTRQKKGIFVYKEINQFFHQQIYYCCFWKLIKSVWLLIYLRTITP